MKKTVFTLVVVIAGFLLVVRSADLEEKPETDFLFWSRMTMGKVVESTVETGGYDVPFRGETMEKIDGGIKVTRRLTPTLTGRLNLGVVVNAATVTPKGLTYEYGSKKVGPVLLDAALQYQRGGLLFDSDRFFAELGYFPFKYNPQSTNLGEYLFRSGTYPGWLISGFEHSIDKPKVGGVHLSYNTGEAIRLRHDLLVSTELEVFPYRDINLTYIFTPAFRRYRTFLELGSGIQYARLISVDPRKTTIGSDPVYKDRYDPKIGYRKIETDDSTSDTTIYRYTFSGIKLMARATFDCKGLWQGWEDIFGPEDLKFYGEAAFLGVKNYPGWYEEPRERVPAMLGFNWPTHPLMSYTVIPGAMAFALEPVQDKKILRAGVFGAAGIAAGFGSWLAERFLGWDSKMDIISIEIERYESPYANAQDYIWKGDSPVPYFSGRPAGSSYPDYDRDWNDSLAQTNDNIKWSVYASKHIGKHVRLSAQAACDHTPKNWYTPWPAPQSAKYSDMVPLTSDWYFMMRMSLYF